jgi:hypothetical protein
MNMNAKKIYSRFKLAIRNTKAEAGVVMQETGNEPACKQNFETYIEYAKEELLYARI